MSETTYGVVSDVHLHNWSQFSKTLPDGSNSRLFDILDAFGDACESLLLAGGTRMYIAGDLFHVRGSIAPSVLNPTLEFFKKYIERGIEFRIIPGNHDLESKNATKLTNAVQALESLGCEICNGVRIFEDDKVVMIPWVEKLDDLRTLMVEIKANLKASTPELEAPENEYTLMIHAPLNGVLKNLPDHGLDPVELSVLNYHRVFCGHYHNFKNFHNGVYSVGALTHQTWSDVGTAAGFLQVNDSGVEQFATEAPRFVDYDFDWDEAEAELFCMNQFVRVKLDEATEEEIKVIREEISEKYGAAGVIVQATPKAKAFARSSSIEAGASLLTSVEQWIEKSFVKERSEAIYENCQKVLEDIAEVEA